MDLSFSIWQPHPDSPKRLDAYLSQCLTESRNTLKSWFADNLVLINDRKPKPSNPPRHKTEVTIQGYVHPSHRTLTPNPHLHIPILYEDADLIVMNKPRGISVNALNHGATDTIANFLLAYDPKISAWDDRFLEPGVVHRLDQWTSGCLIGVRTKAALENIQKQFKNRRVTKIYLALVEGQLEWSEEWIDWLIHDPKNHRKMRCVSEEDDAELPNGARRARLSFTPSKVYKGFSLMEIRLFTGRMHQVRVQFSTHGFPLAGDKLYGAKRPVPFECQWLHAHILSFFHPTTHERMMFRAPIPNELTNFLDTLKA